MTASPALRASFRGPSLPRWSRQLVAAAFGFLSLGLAYLLASRAIDTGSLQQYFLTIVLLVVAFNRFIRIFSNPQEHGNR